MQEVRLFAAIELTCVFFITGQSGGHAKQKEASSRRRNISTMFPCVCSVTTHPSPPARGNPSLLSRAERTMGAAPSRRTPLA